MFGTMHVSHRRTAPSQGFGSSDRGTRSKVHITEEHAKYANHGFHSPGPVYPAKSSLAKQEVSNKPSAPGYSFSGDTRFPSYEADKTTIANPTNNGKFLVPGSGTYEPALALGKQADSNKPTLPDFSFGTASRDAESRKFISQEHAKTDYARVSPGPTVCNMKSSMGVQTASTKESAPQWVMGSDQRFRYDYVERGAKCPGAGQYEAKPALGNQVLSKKKTGPSYSFGSCERDQQKKVYISRDHQKDSHGQMSPGPATVGLPGSCGRQPSSKKPTSSSWGFGTAKRFVYNTHTKAHPGPGSYEYQ